MNKFGTIIAVLPQRNGISAKGNPWRRASYLLETQEQYPKKIAFDVMNDKIDQFNIQQGETLQIYFDIEAKEYFGIWYNSVQVWNVARTAPTQPPHETHNGDTAPFDSWLAQNCPYIHAHYKLPSAAELAKLKEQYPSAMIADTCLQIENRKDLRKKYINLYMTLLNWLKRKENGTNRTNTQQRNAEAARNIAAFLADD